ncbi:MAG TPA: thiamine-phosphate kinase [Polyangiales bacterium]|nr:thiamine-phosphate kinase [Polyangiales bacterium]
MSDEFERIARLRERFQSVVSSDVLVGIGDDAAVIAASPDNLALSVDSAVEGVHFERSFGSLHAIAARAFTAAISDLAAMAARPSSALSSLILPPLTEAEFDELCAGLADASARYRCPIVGGNLASGRELSITTTVIGRLSGRGLSRAGAKPGDRICVTGPLGSAALGLLLLQRMAAERGPLFVERFRSPHARIAEAEQIRDFASAAIDVSDGTLQDLGHVCAASGCGAELSAAALPFEPGFTDLARALGVDPLTLALFGGEDYELIYTVPEDARSIGPGRCIGRITSQRDILVLDEHGHAIELSGRGYRHFAR